jgi:23S rRNA pseudouridine955/2504/2580 synthase
MPKIKITSEEAGMRLDRLTRKRLALLRLSDIYSLIRRGGVRVDGRKESQDYRLIEGETVEIDVNPSELFVSEPDDDTSLRRLRGTDFFKRNFKIIYEDADLFACDKPPGLVVHPGTGHLRRDTLIDLATAYLSEKKKHHEPPVLVHRLDRDTSGVILIAKNRRILRALHQLFRSRSLDKEYHAICHHRPPLNDGIVKLGMSRNFEKRSGTKMRIDEDGGLSQTRYSVLEYHDELSRLEIFLDTGKTHQIRVHMVHEGCPIVGDVRYGNEQLDRNVLKGDLPRRLYLHAHRLVLPHPLTGRNLRIEAPVPEEFSIIMSKRPSRQMVH